MTYAVSLFLLALAAACLGLRTTALLIPRVHPILRLIVAMAIGAMFVIVTLQICASYHVHDLGFGLLLSLSPVGVYDLAKWWIRSRFSRN
jgi:hypothetical protein